MDENPSSSPKPAVPRVSEVSKEEWNSWIQKERRKDFEFRPDLKGQNLGSLELNGYDFGSANLPGVDMSGSSLRKADFSHATLNRAILRNADLTDANLMGASVDYADFTGATLNGSKINKPLFAQKNDVFVINGPRSRGKTNLFERIVELIQEHRSSSKEDANPEHTHRLSATPSDWNTWCVEKAKHDAFFYPLLRGIQVEHTDFSNRYFIGADLRSASLRGCNFSDSILAYADLSDADLRNSDLRTADLTKTQLANANLTGARLPPTPLESDLIIGARFNDPKNQRAPAPKASHDEKGNEAQSTKENALNIQAKLEDLGFDNLSKDDIATLMNILADARRQKYQLDEWLEKIRAETKSIEEFRETFGEITDKIKAINDEITGAADTAAKQAAEEASHGVDDRIKSAVQAVQDNFVFKDAKADWAHKSQQHWWLFGLSLAVFILAVGGLIWLSYVYHEEILTLIPTNKDGEFTVGSFVMITIPIAAIAWVLKMFSRFSLQNLTLAQDAAQRRIIFDTYIKLVQETAPTMSKEDRAIMLAAIFRPLPGAHQTDIAPPTLLDLIGRGDVRE